MVICDEIDKCPQTRKNKGFALANPLFKPSTRPGTRTLNQLIKRQISFILLSAFCENRLQNGCIFYLRLKQTNVNATKANIIPIYSGSGI